MKKLLITTLMLAVFMAFCYAQNDYHVHGTIKDSKGKGIPDAKLILKNKENGRQIVIKTNSEGKYEHAMIPHADYDLKIEKEGYQSATTEWNLKVWGQTPIEVAKDYNLATVEEYKRWKDEGAANELYKEAAEAIRKGDCATATKKAADVIAKFPTHASSYFIVAHCFNQEGKIDDAIANYQQVLKNKPEVEDATYPLLAYQANFELGVLLIKKQDNEGALEAFARAAELKKDDPEVFFYLGSLQFNAGKTDDAKANLEKALTLDPKHAGANRNMGSVYLKLGDFAKAIQYMKAYLELAPNAPDKKQIEDTIAAIDPQKNEAPKEETQKPVKK
jgi:tetratricopeptide (TPR) repeat protein